MGFWGQTTTSSKHVDGNCSSCCQRCSSSNLTEAGWCQKVVTIARVPICCGRVGVSFASAPPSCSASARIVGDADDNATGKLIGSRATRCDGLPSFRHFCHLSCFVLFCCETVKACFESCEKHFVNMPVDSRPTSQFALMRCHLSAL